MRRWAVGSALCGIRSGKLVNERRASDRRGPKLMVTVTSGGGRLQSRIETIPRRRTAPAPPPSRRSTLSPTEPHLAHILSVRRSHGAGVAAMKKPGLTGLKLGIDFGAYVAGFVFCSFRRAVRNHFKHGVERLDGDAGG